MPRTAATLAAAPEPVIDPVPELFPMGSVDWRRGRRILLRAGLLAAPVALAGIVHYTSLTWVLTLHWLIMGVLTLAVLTVVLMVLVVLATLIVKVMRSVQGVGRWLIR